MENKYELTNDEVLRILKQLSTEFQLSLKTSGCNCNWCDLDNKKDQSITFTDDNNPEKSVTHKITALLSSHPPMSNVKYVINNEFGFEYDNSETAKLCNVIHQQHQPKLSCFELV